MPTIHYPAVQFPEAHRAVLTQWLRDYVDDRRSQLEQDCGLLDLPIVEDDELLQTPLAAKLELIARAAAGRIDRDQLSEVMDSISTVCERLFAAPGTASYEIPADFWRAGIGEVLALAQIWAEGDELITLSEAARISGKSLNTIVSLVERGKLRSYLNPAAANPQRGGRLVRRSDV